MQKSNTHSAEKSNTEHSYLCKESEVTALCYKNVKAEFFKVLLINLISDFSYHIHNYYFKVLQMHLILSQKE